WALNHERHVIEVAVGPVLAGLDRGDDWMSALARMAGGVAIRRGIATPDMTAAATDPQTHPSATDRKAILAAGDAFGTVDDDLPEVCAIDHRPSFQRPPRFTTVPRRRVGLSAASATARAAIEGVRAVAAAAGPRPGVGGLRRLRTRGSASRARTARRAARESRRSGSTGGRRSASAALRPARGVRASARARRP